MFWYFIRTFFNINYDEPTSHCVKCKIHYKNEPEKCTAEAITFDLCPYCYNKLSTEQKLSLATTHLKKLENYFNNKIFTGNADFMTRLENQIISEDGQDPDAYRRELRQKDIEKYQEIRNKKLKRLFGDE
jgi:hypothetical protein